MLLATGGLSSLLCDDADDVLNTGGKTDFLNMLERERLADKKTSKTEAVTSMIPAQLLHNPEWKTYLSARCVLTRQLAEQTRGTVDAETPAWARPLPGLDPSLVDDIRLWRAAHNTPDSDLRPTGPTRYGPAERDAQRDLDDRLETAHAGIREWTPRVVEAVPGLAGNPRLPVLAAKLASLDQTGYDALRILHRATSMGVLPDDHPADALGYRITQLVAREPAPPVTWETYTPTHLARPERFEPPPSLGPPSRSPGISR